MHLFSNCQLRSGSNSLAGGDSTAVTNAELLAALNRLDALFSDESKWTKLVAYRDSRGRECNANDAVAYCLTGALATIHDDTYGPIWDELRKSMPLEYVKFSKWNDAPERTFADVKRLIADTRARLEAA